MAAAASHRAVGTARFELATSRSQSERATRLRHVPFDEQCRDDLRRDDDDELPRPVNAFDPGQLDVARRRRARDEHDRAALARARLQRRDQLGHRLDDRVGPDHADVAGRGRGSALGAPGPARRRVRSCRSRRSRLRRSSARRRARRARAAPTHRPRPARRRSAATRRSRSAAMPTRRAPAATSASAAARAGSSVTTTVAR